MAPRVKSGQSAKRALAQPGRSMAQRSLSFACEVDLREAAFVAIAIASDDRGSRITEIDLRCSTRRHARVEVYSRLSRAHANISTPILIWKHHMIVFHFAERRRLDQPTAEYLCNVHFRRGGFRSMSHASAKSRARKH